MCQFLSFFFALCNFNSLTHICSLLQEHGDQSGWAEWPGLTDRDPRAWTSWTWTVPVLVLVLVLVLTPSCHSRWPERCQITLTSSDVNTAIERWKMSIVSMFIFLDTITRVKLQHRQSWSRDFSKFFVIEKFTVKPSRIGWEHVSFIHHTWTWSSINQLTKFIAMKQH